MTNFSFFLFNVPSSKSLCGLTRLATFQTQINLTNKATGNNVSRGHKQFPAQINQFDRVKRSTAFRALSSVEFPGCWIRAKTRCVKSSLMPGLDLSANSKAFLSSSMASVLLGPDIGDDDDGGALALMRWICE